MIFKFDTRVANRRLQRALADARDPGFPREVAADELEDAVHELYLLLQGEYQDVRRQQQFLMWAVPFMLVCAYLAGVFVR